VDWVLFALAVLLAQALVSSQWSDALSAAALVAVGAIAAARAVSVRNGTRNLVLAALLAAGAGALAQPSSSQRAWNGPRGVDASLPMHVESLLEGQISTDVGYNFRGSVVDVAPSSSGGLRLAVAVEDVARDREAPRAATGIVALSIRYSKQRWHTGDRAGFRSRLRRLTSYGNFGEFDWAAYNARRGIFVSAYAWRESDVERLDARRGLVDRVRLALSLACEEAGGQGAAILEALTTGDRFSLTPATALALRDAGLSHFLAISGSHMVLVAALAVGLLRWTLGFSAGLLASYDVMRPAAVAGALAVVAYAAITGGGVSVARSVLMALASLLALWRGRPGDDLRALGGSAVVLAVALPGVGEEAGFQLSYAAVAVLIAYGRHHRSIAARSRKGDVWQAVRATAAKMHAGDHRREVRGTAASIHAGDHRRDLRATAAKMHAGDHRRDLRVTAASIHAGDHRQASLLLAVTKHEREHSPEPPLAAAQGAASGPVGGVSRGLALIFEAAKLTVVCCLVTSPIVAQHFHRVSIVAPLSNLFAAPLVSAVVVVGLGALLVEPLSPAAQHLLVWLGARLGDALVWVATAAASLPFASLAVPAPGAVLTVALAAVPFVVLSSTGAARAAALAALGAAAAVCLALGLSDRYRDDRLDAWFAAVGQGDAGVLRLPGGKVVVIDAGAEGRGRMVVEPLLRRLWIGRIDLLVASHLQSDHAGAFVELLDAFEVGELWIPAGPRDGPVASAVLAKARELGISVRSVSAGDVGSPICASTPAPTHITVRSVSAGDVEGTAGAPGDVRSLAGACGTGDASDERSITCNGAVIDATRAATLEVLGPPVDCADCGANDQSLVLAVGFAGHRLLFTGDIEEAAERALLRAQAPLAAELLKVPHHGSRSSSTSPFLDAVAPTLAVVSVGLENHYGFPDREVEGRYLARGIGWLRTDQVGAVHVVVDANGLRFDSARGLAVPGS